MNLRIFTTYILLYSALTGAAVWAQPPPPQPPLQPNPPAAGQDAEGDKKDDDANAFVPAVGNTKIDNASTVFNAALGKVDPVVLATLWGLSLERAKGVHSLLTFSWGDRGKALNEMKQMEFFRTTAKSYAAAYEAVRKNSPRIMGDQLAAREAYQNIYGKYIEELAAFEKKILETNGQGVAEQDMLKEATAAIERLRNFNNVELAEAWIAKYKGTREDLTSPFEALLKAEKTGRTELELKTNKLLAEMNTHLPLTDQLSAQLKSEGPGQLMLSGTKNGIRITDGNMDKLGKGMQQLCIDMYASLDANYSHYWWRSRNMFQWARVTRPFVSATWAVGIFGLTGYVTTRFVKQNGADVAKVKAQTQHNADVKKAIKVKSDAKIYTTLKKNYASEDGIKKFVVSLREVLKGRVDPKDPHSPLMRQRIRDDIRDAFRSEEMRTPELPLVAFRNDAELDEIILSAIADANTKLGYDMDYDQLVKWLNHAGKSPLGKKDLKEFMTAVYSDSLDALFPDASMNKRGDSKVITIGASRFVDGPTIDRLFENTLPPMKDLDMKHSKEVSPHEKIEKLIVPAPLPNPKEDKDADKIKVGKSVSSAAPLSGVLAGANVGR